MPPDPSRRWDELVREFVDTSLEARPHLAVAAGRHEQDGRLPDWSAGGLRSERRRLRRTRDHAEGQDPDDLDEPRRLERLHLLSVLDGELFWLERARRPERNPFFYLEALSPRVYVARPYASPEERARALAAHARRIPGAVAQIRSNLRPPLPAPHVEVAGTVFRRLGGYFGGDARGAFGGMDRPDLRRELDGALEEAGEAMRGLAGWLAEVETAPVQGSLLGPDLFREMLWATERIETPPSRLEEVARASLERNHEALERACRRLDDGGTTERSVRRVRAERPDDSLVAEADRQIRRLREGVAREGLASLPPGGETRVEASPPFLRWNPAMIDIPGPCEGDVPALFYITAREEGDADGPEDLSRRELLYVAAHEVWPGHFLHFLHAHRSSSPLVRHFQGYALTEGWAHYAEELCWETGLAGDHPAAEVALRLSALLRNVRFVVALGLHGGSLSMDDAEALFREKAFLDPSSARQQAARGAFDPEYLGYTLGKLVIRKLRRDWCRDRGGRSAWREFHDRLLSLGAPPLSVARQALMGPGDGELL